MFPAWLRWLSSVIETLTQRQCNGDSPGAAAAGVMMRPNSDDKLCQRIVILVSAPVKNNFSLDLVGWEFRLDLDLTIRRQKLSN